MLRSRRPAEEQPARRRLAVRRQARPADRRILFGRAELRPAQPQCHRQTGQDARPRQHRRQSARRRLCRGGRSLGLYGVDQGHDRRSRHRHRHHRRRTAESAARTARTQSAHRQRNGRRRLEARGLHQRDVDRLYRVHQGLAQIAAEHRGDAGSRSCGRRHQVADRLCRPAQGGAGHRVEFERLGAGDAGEDAEERQWRGRARRSRIEEAC